MLLPVVTSFSNSHTQFSSQKLIFFIILFGLVLVRLCCPFFFGVFAPIYVCLIHILTHTNTNTLTLTYILTQKGIVSLLVTLSAAELRTTWNCFYSNKTSNKKNVISSSSNQYHQQNQQLDITKKKKLC